MRYNLSIFKLIRAIISRNRKNLIITVEVFPEDQMVDIWFADFKLARLGFEEFNNPNCREDACFDDVEIIDGGNTLRFGEFEAASDWIRYGD
jgi:hypothetical protein